MPSGEERPIAFASRTLRKAETNYAQIECEALGIVFRIWKFHQYLFRRKFTLLTDHQPMTSIFGPHTGIPPLAASRMQRWALLLSVHTYEIKYRKSTLHGNADGLSRLPLPVNCRDIAQKESFYFEQVENTPITAIQVKKATRVDPVLSQVMDLVMHGTSRRTSLVSPDLVTYMSRRTDLSIQSGCLLWGRRAIIPPPLRSQVLEQLHSSHCGIVHMKEIAQSYFWWPGLDSAIEEKARACMSCQGVRNAPQWAPLHPWDWPENLWQRIHVDFSGPLEGSMFLVVVDAHSKWPEVSIMQSTTAESTIQKLQGLFSRFGLPEQLVSDNGPQFVSQEFQKFMKANGIHHITSAPYHPSTNGLAERSVQTMKQALKSARGQLSIQKRLDTFLLSYRNTPHATTKASPAYLMMGRQLSTCFDLLKPSEPRQIVQRQQQDQIIRWAP
uniref:Gypsy retrotransposon integrase-like protein 1 n=1 Tax=Chrysemys picta bellii TaxID=8478 RepID=A0A8C3HCL2_CHRPI